MWKHPPRRAAPIPPPPSFIPPPTWDLGSGSGGPGPHLGPPPNFPPPHFPPPPIGAAAPTKEGSPHPPRLPPPPPTNLGSGFWVWGPRTSLRTPPILHPPTNLGSGLWVGGPRTSLRTPPQFPPLPRTHRCCSSPVRRVPSPPPITQFLLQGWDQGSGSGVPGPHLGPPPFPPPTHRCCSSPVRRAGRWCCTGR